MLHWSGLMFKMTIRVNNSYLMIHLPLKIIMIINALELIIIFVITIATPIIFIILLKVSPRCNFGQTSFSQPGGNTWHLHRGTFLHPLQHHPLLILIFVIISTTLIYSSSTLSVVREGLNGKKTFSFGHCPNHLNPPP